MKVRRVIAHARTIVFRFTIEEISGFLAKLLYAVAYVDGCCHPPLADSVFRVPPVPGRHAPGSMEKIKLSRGHPQDTRIIPHRASIWQARCFEIFGRVWMLLSAHTHRDRNRINKATLQQRLSRRSSQDQYQRICGRCDRRRHRTPVSHSLPSLSKETSCGHEADERLARSLVSKDTPCQIV